MFMETIIGYMANNIFLRLGEIYLLRESQIKNQ